MNRITRYISQSLQTIYSPQELKSLTMMIYCDLLGLDAMDVYLGKDINLSESKQCELENILSRLQKNEPIQYVHGVAHFLGLIFKVAPGVLIPRPETEGLVNLLINENGSASQVLDIGTGSGCIAISISKKLPHANVTAWDISEDALSLARQNNDMLQCTVRFEQRDVLAVDASAISQRYDVIVSNPPYVTETEQEAMEPNVLDWEPALALFVPNEDPLCFYRRIALLGRTLLLPLGKLYFEINQAYGADTVRMLEELDYHHIRVIKDLFGKDRIVIANK